MEPQIKPAKLIVAMALCAMRKARSAPHSNRAKCRARSAPAVRRGFGRAADSMLARSPGRSADLTNGVFGQPEVIFQWGAIPDME